MIEFITKKPRLSVSFSNQNEIEITFNAQRYVASSIEKLNPDKELIVTVKEFSKKRSLSQNAYLWVLLDQIGEKTNQNKEQVYKNYIKDYGVFQVLPIKNEAVEMFTNKWAKNGLGWICEDMGESKLDGFTKLIAYFGSSTYTSKEMSRLISAVVDDCVELGISTLTYDEILKLKNDND